MITIKLGVRYLKPCSYASNLIKRLINRRCDEDENCPYFVHDCLNLKGGSMVSFLYKDSKSSLIKEVYDHEKATNFTK